jgi:hypothetical protein
VDQEKQLSSKSGFSSFSPKASDSILSTQLLLRNANRRNEYSDMARRYAREKVLEKRGVDGWLLSQRRVGELYSRRL